MIRQSPCSEQNTGIVVCMNVWSLFYFFISATNSLAFATALVMWSQIWSSPISRSIFAFLRVACTVGLTPDRMTCIFSFCDEVIRISRLWIAVESIKGTFRMRIMRTSGRSAILRISSSNLVATPKKNGPSIS